MEKTINKQENRENRFGYSPYTADFRNIFVYPIPTNDYVMYVDDLSWLEDHQERLQLIRMATPDDSIRIVINSPGGVVSIAMAYVSAMAESAANIVTHAEGNVCSAGTILWLAGEERTVSPLTMFMFHNYQGGTYGDGANMHSQIIFEKEYFDRLISRFYDGVLTDEEINRIKGGGQVWMDEVQVLERAKAVLLDAKNIKRMQRGQPPLSQRKADEPAPLPSPNEIEAVESVEAVEPAQKKVKINIILNGEEFILEAANLDSQSLAQFSTKELFAILVQVGKLAGSDVLEEGFVTGDTHRDKLIEHLKVYGEYVSDLYLSQNEED